MSIIKTFIFTLLFTLSFPARSPALAPQLGSHDSLSPLVSPPSPESYLTPPPSSPLTPSPENSYEGKEGGSGGKKARIVVGVVAALLVVGLGQFGGVLYNKLQQNIRRPVVDNHHNNQPNRIVLFDESAVVMGMSVNDDQYQYYLIGDRYKVVRLDAPDFLSSLTNIIILDPVFGYQCLVGEDVHSNKWAVMWDPTDGDCIPIDVNPNEGFTDTVVSFGECVIDGDAHAGIVKISVMENMWDVHFLPLTLGQGEWIFVERHMPPFRSCKMECGKVCENGVIYSLAFGEDPFGQRRNFLISFDLENTEIGIVHLPRDLVNTDNCIQLVKVNRKLALLEYHGGFCHLWAKKERDNGTFFKRIYTIRVEGHLLDGNVLGFGDIGDVIIELNVNNSNEESRIVVYDLFRGHITDVGINGRQHKFSVSPL